jgi:5-methylthioadenosine/S-adenosylhomocysteine deaminase
MIEEARFCGLVHRAAGVNFEQPSSEQLLKLATLDGARALRLESEIGSLEVGKQADLIAIDLSRAHNSPVHDSCAAIIFSAVASDVIFTAVAGRVLYDGELRGLDEVDLRQRANEAQTRMRQI